MLILFSIIGIHYQKGAEANNAQEREKDRASKGEEGGYREDVGDWMADEGGGRERREEA